MKPANIVDLTEEQRAAIIAARELIQNQNDWTQDTSARNEQGEVVDPCDDSAVCFCSAGALYRVVHGRRLQYDQAVAKLNTVASSLYGVGLIDVNDEIGHAAAMRVFAVTLGEDDPGEGEV